ncbi:MAG: matrixin family metalloprotease [Armatimonadota bacterium]|nr:matrixin family metalloprotease [Armatimonadota bacterium]
MRQIDLRGQIRKFALLAACVACASVASAQGTRIGECVTTETMSVVFAAGTPSAEIDRVIAKIRKHEAGLTDYQPAGRWTLTSYGNTGSYGTACRFGYSFVPDGTYVPNSGLGDGFSELYGLFTAQFGSQALWQLKFRQMFDRWGELSGLEYFEVADDGAPLHFFPGQLGQRGDLRISCIPLLEPFVLAYNFYPNVGDMVINSTFNWATPANDYRFLRNVLGHEHGHGMGLAHVMPMNETKLMEPVLSTVFDGPQYDDIQGCQFLYGDVREENDEIGVATDLGMVANGTAIELLAIERPADRDWFLVEIPEGFALSVTAFPVGQTYMVGPQGGQPALRNSLRINDLRISAYQSDGVTFIGSSNSAGMGFPETLTSITRPASGVVSVKIDVTTIAEDIQRYRLVFNLTSAATTYGPTGYTLLQGVEISGGLAALQFSDDFRLKLNPTPAFDLEPLQFEVRSTSAILNPTSLIFGYEGSSSAIAIRRRILLFDYDANVWVQIDSAQGPTVEQTFEFPQANPGRFIAADGSMKARIFCMQNGPLFSYPWETSTDYVFWRIGQ